MLSLTNNHRELYLDRNSVRYINAPLVLAFNKDTEAWAVVRNKAGFTFKTQQDYKDFIADDSLERFVYEDSSYHLVLVFE